jgi:hypothetical protein
LTANHRAAHYICAAAGCATAAARRLPKSNISCQAIIDVLQAREDRMERLAHDWHIAPYWPEYIFFGFMLQVLIRAVMSGLSAIILFNRSDKKFWDCYRLSFWGFHPDDPEHEKSNYGFTFILGLLELYSYPVLMATGAWTVIGAWLGFKTVAQWKSWGIDRVIFNHYLIGNVLVVLLSLMCLVRFVATTPPGCAP